MPVEILLQSSVELMVIGMGTVFVILGLMIWCMNLLRVFAPSEEPLPTSQDDKPLIAAIQAAIHQYRNRSAH